jgi:hypothetical protein
MAINRNDLEARALAGKSDFETLPLAGLGDVRLRKRLSQAEYLKHLDRLAASPKEVDGEHDGFRRLYPSILVSGVVDDAGEPVFAGIDDPLFADFEIAHMVAIGDALLKLWGLEKPQEPADVLKNSPAAPT